MALGASSKRLILVSTAVFVVLNVVENLAHYTIGKHAGDKNKPNPFLLGIDWPNRGDILRIAITTVVFAALHIGITCLLTACHLRLPTLFKK